MENYKQFNRAPYSYDYEDSAKVRDPTLYLRIAYQKGVPFYISAMGTAFYWSVRQKRFCKTRKNLCTSKQGLLHNPQGGYIKLHWGGVTGEYRAIYLHRAVAIAYLQPPSIFHTQVDHLDGDMYNNRLDNLEWVTPSENRRRAIAARKKAQAEGKKGTIRTL